MWNHIKALKCKQEQKACMRKGMTPQRVVDFDLHVTMCLELLPLFVMLWNRSRNRARYMSRKLAIRKEGTL